MNLVVSERHSRGEQARASRATGEDATELDGIDLNFGTAASGRKRVAKSLSFINLNTYKIILDLVKETMVD